MKKLLDNITAEVTKAFVEAGYDVPKVLVKGLEVADKVVNKDSEDE